MMSRNKIKFGVLLQGPGANRNAWKDGSVPPNASINFDYYVEMALKAENAGIDFIFIADGLYIDQDSSPHFLNRFEPITLLSSLASLTQRIGLVSTVSTSYSEPFNVARQLASLDMISSGRAGWNVVTSPLEGSGSNFGRKHPNHEMRYQIATEHIEVVKGLWQSWEEDAFVYDKKTNRYFDKSKLHPLNYNGSFFSVKGPINISRSLQGEPVIFQAGTSEDGIKFAAKYADAIFTDAGTLNEGISLYNKYKEKARYFGRNSDDVKIFPGIGPIVGLSKQSADLKYKNIRSLITPEDALKNLSHFFNQYDFSQHELDDPFPQLGDIGNDGFRFTTDHIKQYAYDRSLTLREVAYEVSMRRSNIGTSEDLNFIGTPEDVANEIIEWYEKKACDGFMLVFPVLGFGLDDFVQLVLPILEHKGYFSKNNESLTLRNRLGLDSIEQD